jgi:hypothetical protein
VSASTSGAAEKIKITIASGLYGPPGQRQIMIENEILEIRICSAAEGGDGTRGFVAATNEVCVIRGQYGTAATAHSVGIKPKISTNQINNYLRPTIGTQDDNVYLITWDSYWTDSYLNIGIWDTGQKTFQFTGKGEQKLFEPKLTFSGDGEQSFNPVTDIAVVTVRSYNSLNSGQTIWASSDGNTMGPGFSASGNPISPRAGTFIIKPNVWTRWWVRIDQRSNDWDRFDIWVADEKTEPILIYSQVLMSVGKSLDPNYQNVDHFWFEQGNSSTQYLRGSLKDLVSYHRNWAVLKNPPNNLAGSGLFARPLP